MYITTPGHTLGTLRLYSGKILRLVYTAQYELLMHTTEFVQLNIYLYLLNNVTLV